MRKSVFFIFLILLALLISTPTEAICVKAPKANIRSGPGKDFKVTWEVFMYMPFSKVGKSSSGEWIAVKDVDGDVNWVHRSTVTEKMRCAVVTAKEAVVRSGPGTNHSKSSISPVAHYYSFKVLGKKGEWINVIDEWGNSGWIHEKLVWVQ